MSSSQCLGWKKESLYVAGRIAVCSAMVMTATMPGYAQMTMPGQFAVSRSGASTYAVPVKVMPGAGGLVPGLVLVYNSQAGNGSLGVGWSLSGLSSITRCPRTQAQDGLNAGVNNDSNDRYCLDGERLIAISGTDGGNGTEYRTEQESFSKIVSYAETGAINGPGSFIVKTKAGLTMEYGKTEDSRIEAQGRIDSSGHGVVIVWALNKVTDAKGNNYTISYYEDNPSGEYYPTRITYSGGLTVDLSYDVRPDPIFFYTAGSKFSITKRMSKVVTAGGQYDLQYATSTATGQSVISSIKYSSTSGAVLDILQVSRQDGANGLSEVSNASIGGWNSSIQQLVMDVNGDGKADLVRIWQNGSSAWADVWLANASGTGFTEVSNASIGGWNSTIQQLVMDVNGDGKADLVRIWQNGSSAWADVWLANTSGTGFTEVSNASIGGWNTNIQQLVMDVNGDGKADLVRIWQNGSSAWADVWLANASGTGFTEVSNASIGGWNTSIQQLAMDVNGDGKNDIVRIWQNGSTAWADVWTANEVGTGFTEVSNAPLCSWGSDIRAMDVNGDGKADLVCIWQNGSSTWADVWIATGNGFVEIWNAAIGGWNAAIQHLVMDVNGDGKADLVRIWQNGSDAWANIWVANAQGTGFTEVYNAAIGGWNTDIQHLVMDVNGDGKADLVRIWQNGSSAWADVWQSSGAQANLASNLCNSVSCAAVGYSPMSSVIGSAYQSNVASTWPLVSVGSAISLVTQSTANNGLGGTRTTSYSYGNLLTSVGNGRGSLGFQWTQSKDAATGLVSRTCYRQDWPYIGMVDKVMTATTDTGLPACSAITDLSPLAASGSSLLSMNLNKYTFTATDPSGNAVTCKDPDTSSPTCASGAIKPGKRYQVYGFESFSQSRDWDGTNFLALPATHTTQTQDSWGNVTSVMAETLKADGKTPSGYSKTTTNTFAAPDTSNWLLGRLLKSSVTATAP